MLVRSFTTEPLRSVVIDASHQASDTRRQTQGIRQKASDKSHQTKGIRQKASDKRHQTKGIRQKASDKRHQTKGIRQKASDLVSVDNIRMNVTNVSTKEVVGKRLFEICFE